MSTIASYQLHVLELHATLSIQGIPHTLRLSVEGSHLHVVAQASLGELRLPCCQALNRAEGLDSLASFQVG